MADGREVMIAADHQGELETIDLTTGQTMQKQI